MNTLQIHKAIVEDMIQEDLDNQRTEFIEALMLYFIAIRPGEEKDFPQFFIDDQGQIAWFHDTHWAQVQPVIKSNQTAQPIENLDKILGALVDKYQTLKGLYFYLDKGNYFIQFDDQDDYFQDELDNMYQATPTNKLFIAID